LAIRGSLIHEAGPFTERNVSSRDLAGRLEFIVGRPWGNTALLTGYYGRDLLYGPLTREFYTTSSYAGIQHKFGDKMTVRALFEYVRTWRVFDQEFGAGQLIRPGGEVHYKANRNWAFDGSISWSRGQGFSSYDNIQGGFYISYVKPLRRTLNDGAEGIPVEYPLRFSFGLEQQDFYNFTGRSQSAIRPVVRLTLF
jgi:hypothetical protein